MHGGGGGWEAEKERERNIALMEMVCSALMEMV